MPKVFRIEWASGSKASTSAHSVTLTQVLSNLTSTQIYVVDGLAPGLTQLWSQQGYEAPGADPAGAR